MLGNEQEEEERLCVACDPQSQVTCRNPLEHRGHLVWKCRYCCRPSTHLCYGNVHFCDECHARNSQRVCQLQQTAFGRSTLTGNKPPPLSPIPCLGENCPYPKPANSSKHSNGLTSQSEQVYACAFCQSTRLSPFMDEPGSRNLLHNSSGQYQLQGWRQLNPNMSWAVETSDLPVNTSTTTNFVSSYLLCVMQQILDLSTVLRIRSPNLSMEVSARYMGRTDCPSVFCLKAFLLDEHLRPITEQATPKLEAPPDYWERARLVLSTTEASRYIVVIVMGKDSRFWQGLYGSKVAEISIRLLGSTQEIERLIRPQYATTRNMISPQTIGEVGHRVREGNMDSDPPTTRTLFRDGLLPIVCLLILAWFMQN